jgi:putative tricarboxylic transport membrane protein
VKINPLRLGDAQAAGRLGHWRTILRSGVIGTFIGIVPGVGEDVAAWSSYAAAKRASKEPEKFGKGSIDGLMAAETGDNACVPGAMIPVLTLGAGLGAGRGADGGDADPRRAPGPDDHDRVAAVRVRRGRDDAVATLGILLLRPDAHQAPDPGAAVPTTMITPIIFVLCTVGSFALAGRLFDVWVMLLFGLLGFVLRQFTTRWRRWCWASCSAT